VVNNSADVISSGRSFHVCRPVTGKARLPTVDSLLVGTSKRLVPTERSDRRLSISIYCFCKTVLHRADWQQELKWIILFNLL